MRESQRTLTDCVKVRLTMTVLAHPHFPWKPISRPLSSALLPPQFKSDLQMWPAGTRGSRLWYAASEITSHRTWVNVRLKLPQQCESHFVNLLKYEKWIFNAEWARRTDQCHLSGTVSLSNSPNVVRNFAKHKLDHVLPLPKTLSEFAVQANVG